MEGRSRERVAIVTGASRGIGAGIARRLAAEGAAVALVGRTADPVPGANAGSLAETAAAIRDAGGRAHPIVADLADPQVDRAAIVAEAAAELGDVDILVNNAAACFYLPYDEVSARRYAVMLEVNVHAPWDLSRAALPGMRARGQGWILNVSSVVAEHPPGPPYPAFHVDHGATLYGLSKAALERMTTGLAAETSRDGIRVNALSPVAAVATPGAVAMGLVPEDPALVEPVEQMAEAALALCSGDLTGRVVTSGPLLRELAWEVRGLDGRPTGRSRVRAPFTGGTVMGQFTRDEMERAYEHYRAVAAAAGASGDWNQWADLFTEDAEYFEHLYGKFKGREEIRTWITATMAEFPNMEMTDFPADWYVIDDERGWVVCAVWNRMQDLGDGEVHQAVNWSLLKYAGNDQWSYEEDIYRVEEFADMIKGYMAARKDAKTG